jgi:hypothetical protein
MSQANSPNTPILSRRAALAGIAVRRSATGRGRNFDHGGG